MILAYFCFIHRSRKSGCYCLGSHQLSYFRMFHRQMMAMMFPLLPVERSNQNLWRLTQQKMSTLSTMKKKKEPTRSLPRKEREFRGMMSVQTNGKPCMPPVSTHMQMALASAVPPVSTLMKLALASAVPPVSDSYAKSKRQPLRSKMWQWWQLPGWSACGRRGSGCSSK